MERTNAKVDYAAWMRAAQTGDEDAYRRLLETLEPVLRRYLRRRLRDEEAVADIGQDVLLTMHRVRHTYEPERPFEPWFFSIARSRLIDYVRRSKRVRAHEIGTDVLPESADDQTAPDWQRFLEILDGLPANQREAFVMLKVDGLSTAEAAERAGIKVSALKVRAHRAYNALKKALLAEET